MIRFARVEELAAFLGELNPDYAEHAAALWQKQVRTLQQLANFSEPHYLACGVPEGHIDDIKVRASDTGEQVDHSILQHCSVRTLNSSTHSK